VVKFSKGCGPGESLLTPNFVKIAEGDIPLFRKFIQKNTNFGDFGASKPSFLKPQSWSLASGCGPGTPSPRLILYKKNRSRGLLVLHCLWSDAYWFLVCECLYCHIIILVCLISWNRWWLAVSMITSLVTMCMTVMIHRRLNFCQYVHFIVRLCNVTVKKAATFQGGVD